MHRSSQFAGTASTEDRLAELEARLQALEREVEAGRGPRAAASATGLDRASRLVALEQAVDYDRRRLFDATAQRLRDFRRRLGTEWAALRLLHEEAIAAVRQRADAAALAERRRDNAAIALIVVLVVVGADAAYLHWRLRAVNRTAAAQALQPSALPAAVDARLAASEQASRGARTAAQSAASQAAQMIDVVAAADTRRLTLLGDAFAPAASGQVLWSRSRGLLLSAIGTPPLDAGSVYQIWMLTSRGPVGIGFALPDARGRLSAAYETPAELSGTVTGVKVTREAAGGAATPGSVGVLSSR